MSVPMLSLIRRHMKRSAAFSPCENVADLPVPISLERGEALVGWYRNPSPWEDNVVVFSTLAVYDVNAERVLKTRFDEIVEYETPKDKANATGVRLQTADGFRFVRIGGRHGPNGKFADVFDFLMILQVIVAHRRRMS